MLKTNKLTFSYKTRRGRQRVFQELDLELMPGFNVILGPNGAGKSTLLKAIFGLLKYQGRIYYGEACITDMNLDERTEIMAYLPQSDLNNSSLTVLEMVLLGLLPELGRKVKKKDIRRAVETLNNLNIGKLSSRIYSELSGGQKKMVFIAQTLVRKPQLILLDEPVNSLDLQKQIELCHLLKDLTESNTTSLVLVLHDINLAARFADHLVILDDEGRLYSQGSPSQTITPNMLKEVYGVIASLHYDEGIPSISVKASVNQI